ncbi:MAG: hypothetical protein WC725_04720 [Patescibacteria group bacterium]|jgi:hypothetical protein
MEILGFIIAWAIIAVVYNLFNKQIHSYISKKFNKKFRPNMVNVTETQQPQNSIKTFEINHSLLCDYCRKEIKTNEHYINGEMHIKDNETLVVINGKAGYLNIHISCINDIWQKKINAEATSEEKIDTK